MRRLITAIVTSLALFTAPVYAEEMIRSQVDSAGSTMFTVSAHLSSMLKQRHGYNLEVATGFPGVRSQVNVAKGEAELGLYAPPLAFFLTKGIAMYKGLKNHAELAGKLRPLVTYEGDMFLLGTYDPKIKSVADLEGKRVFLGPKGAALVNINAGLIEAATGLVANEDYELVHVDWSGAGPLLQDGSADVVLRMCTVGCGTWTELATGKKVYFVGYTEEMLAKEGVKKRVNFPGRHIKVLQPDAFGAGQGNTEPVNVVGEFTGLVTNDQMSDETAYNIVKAFWETREDLAKIIPAANDYKLKNATFGMINTIHPGAAKYYKEQGIPVPE